MERERIILNVETRKALWRGKVVELSDIETGMLIVVGMLGNEQYPCGSKVIGSRVWPIDESFNRAYWGRMAAVYAKRLRSKLPGLLYSSNVGDRAGYWLSAKLILVKNAHEPKESGMLRDIRVWVGVYP